MPRKSYNGTPTDLIKKFQSEEERNEYTRIWKNATYLINPIKEYILAQIDALQLDQEVDYANPNWAYVRADKNGQIKALEKVLKLLP